jgi:hypothetical protein
VEVGEVDEGDISERLKGKEVFLPQALLRECTRPAPRQEGRRGDGDLKKLAA